MLVGFEPLPRPDCERFDPNDFTDSSRECCEASAGSVSIVEFCCSLFVFPAGIEFLDCTTTVFAMDDVREDNLLQVHRTPRLYTYLVPSFSAHSDQLSWKLDYCHCWLKYSDMTPSCVSCLLLRVAVSHRQRPTK